MRMKVEEIDVKKCCPFRENPFGVRDDEEMRMLTESIRERGVMVPIVVRPREEGSYEIISGHRRIHACTKAGIEKIPAFVREMSRSEAIICMVDSNLHREHILPSEKAFAYRMKLEAIKHQGRTSRQNVGKVESAELISDTESGRTVQRYIRLTKLIPQLLRLVDEKRIAFSPAVELSFLSARQQSLILEMYRAFEATPSYSQAVRMHKLSEQGRLTDDAIHEIMSELKGNQREVLRLPAERYGRYLDRFSTPREKEAFIVKALDYYTRYLDREKDWGDDER